MMPSTPPALCHSPVILTRQVALSLSGVTVQLTLRAGYSPTDARFFAAYWSRCRLVPQSGQERQRMDTPLATTTSQPEQIRLV
jgi:hypothetical protein